MTAPLFDVDPIQTEVAEKLSADRRRTQRQAEHLAQGLHPLSAALGYPIQLHADAAPADDRRAAGLRCGSCWFRVVVRGYSPKPFPKCTIGDNWPRATHGAGTDVRRWWPACRDYSKDAPAVTS